MTLSQALQIVTISCCFSRVVEAETTNAAAAHNNLAQVYKMKAQCAKADPHYRQAIEIWETTVGPLHPNVGKGLMNLADLNRVHGKLAGSAKLLERAIAIFQPGSMESLDARNRLSTVYAALGLTIEARRLHRGLASISLLQSNLR